MLSFVYASAPQAFAADPVRIERLEGLEVAKDFLVGPARTILTVEPGGTYTVVVEVTNRYGYDAVFDMSTEEFESEGKTQTSFFKSTLPDSPRHWVTVNADSIELSHADRGFLRVTINVPKDAPPGDHQAALIVKARAAPSGLSGISVESRVASLFILSIPGDLDRSGRLLSFRVYDFLNWSLPVFMNMEAQNDGNVHMLPKGTVEIRNLLGVTVDELEIKDWVVLRNATRSLDLEWRPWFAFGYYTATTNMTIHDQPVGRLSEHFWVIPLRLILFILLALFIISFLFQYILSRFEIRRKTDEPKKNE